MAPDEAPEPKRPGGSKSKAASPTSETDTHAQVPVRTQDQPSASLVVISHPQAKHLGRCIEIPNREIVLGRSSACDVSFPDINGMSRRHARLKRRDGKVLLEDLGSKNGCFVNGIPVDQTHPLENGDRLDLQGLSLKFFDGDHVETAFHEAVYDLLMRDELTSIFNRRKFEEELERDFLRASRHHRPLALIAFDIDEFKEINDLYGHLCGDRVLQGIARILDHNVRRDGVYARVGGDEFVIICAEVDAAGAQALAERLRAVIAEHQFEDGDSRFGVTCSFGVAGLTPDMVHPKDLYQEADAALLASKSSGRDRITVFSEAR